MSIGEGSGKVFLERPMSIALIVVIVAVLVLPRMVTANVGCDTPPTPRTRTRCRSLVSSPRACAMVGVMVLC
jgi:hypothetical protein